jgi:hypothetical protein
MRKVFFTSRDFPWHLVIYPGSGPPFGRAYGWTVRPIDEIGAADCDVGIVENRLLAGDVACLERHLAAPGGPRFPLVLKVSDPEMPLSRHEGTRWLFSVADRPGVHYASVYEPAGPLGEFLAARRASKTVRVPFPYDATREVERPFHDRRRRVFLSGAHNRRLYPFREALFRRHAWNPLARAVLHRLPHPGYPDTGATPRHDVVGARYVERAARFTHFLLDPSRYGVELMKYTECAYAGSVPIGRLPSSLTGEVEDAFVATAGSTRDLRRAIRAPREELEALASRYRRALRAARDPRRLDAVLDEQIREAIGA